MKNPKSVYRYMFIAALGFLLVGILFTITKFPAGELFSVLGGLSVLVFYVLFSRGDQRKNRSNYARHLAILSLIIGQIAKSFELEFGTYFFLIALVAFLVWFAWSVLEDLPPSEE